MMRLLCPSADRDTGRRAGHRRAHPSYPPPISLARCKLVWEGGACRRKGGRRSRWAYHTRSRRWMNRGISGFAYPLLLTPLYALSSLAVSHGLPSLCPGSIAVGVSIWAIHGPGEDTYICIYVYIYIYIFIRSVLIVTPLYALSSPAVFHCLCPGSIAVGLLVWAGYGPGEDGTATPAPPRGTDTERWACRWYIIHVSISLSIFYIDI
jgi:hypothetical protein